MFGRRRSAQPMSRQMPPRQMPAPTQQQMQQAALQRASMSNADLQRAQLNAIQAQKRPLLGPQGPSNIEGVMGINRPSGLQAKAAQMSAQAAGGMGMGGLQKSAPLPAPTPVAAKPLKKGGSVKSSASKRADGCAQRGKTKGRMV